MANKREMLKINAARVTDSLDGMFSPEVRAMAEEKSEPEKKPSQSSESTRDLPAEESLKETVVPEQTPESVVKPIVKPNKSDTAPTVQRKTPSKTIANKPSKAREVVSSGNKTARPSFYMTEDIAEKLKVVARMQGISLNALLTTICEEYLDENKDEIDFFMKKYAKHK